MKKGQYVLGFYCVMGFYFIGQLEHVEKGYVELSNAYVLGIAQSNFNEFFNDNEEEEEEEEYSDVEIASNCSENFVISGDFYIMSITKEIYDATVEKEWEIPKNIP